MATRLKSLNVALLVLPGALALCVAASAHAEPATETPAAPGEAQRAETPAPTLSAASDITLASKYLFQGIDYSEGHAVLQPNATLGVRNFSVNFWGNFQNDIADFNEIDVALKYAHGFGPLSVTTGYVNLQYPNREGWDPSQELFVDLGLSAALSPTLSMHYDFDAGKGTYWTLGVSHPVGSSLTFGTNVFYQSRYYEMTGIPAVELKSTWKHAVGNITLFPSISYFVTWPMEDFRDDLAVPATWSFSVNVSPSF